MAHRCPTPTLRRSVPAGRFAGVGLGSYHEEAVGLNALEALLLSPTVPVSTVRVRERRYMVHHGFVRIQGFLNGRPHSKCPF